MAFTYIGFKHECYSKSAKAAIAAKLAGINLEFPEFVFGSTETPAYYLNCSPTGRVPSLQTEEGYIFESGAILRHIARCDKNNSFIYGRTAFEASQCDAWIDFVTTELDDGTGSIFVNGIKFREFPEAVLAEKNKVVLEALKGVDAWLEIRTFLVGERITIADAAMVASLHPFLTFSSEAGQVWAKYKNVIRYYNTVVANPLVLAGFQQCGAFKAAEKPKEAAPAKAEKPKEAAKPKEAPKPAAAAAKDDDDEDDAVKEEPKKPNPLDALPPSKFVLDAFKREYSNKDTRTEAAPWFFDNFDNEGFTAFWCKYKYNEDLKMQFMTANLIRGWFQRMEHTRKYAFGVALIVGEDKKHEVSALWIFRGKGLPEIVREVEDTELFDWVEIPDINAQRAEITDYLAWEGPTIKGGPVLEGRAFK